MTLMMHPAAKALVTLEVLVCFGPMTLMLTIGALLVPIQILALFHEPLLWMGPVQLIGSVLCGGAGLAALVFLLSRLFEPFEVPIARPWLVLGGALLGMMPLIDVVTSPLVGWRVLGAMPIASAVHILFLSRRMLFSKPSKQ